jgi:hypothetical protein
MEMRASKSGGASWSRWIPAVMAGFRGVLVSDWEGKAVELEKASSVIFPRNGWVAERRTNNIDYSRVASVSYDEWIVNILCIGL